MPAVTSLPSSTGWPPRSSTPASPTTSEMLSPLAPSGDADLQPRPHDADSSIARVRYVDVALRVRGDSERIGQLSSGCRIAVPAVALAAGAGERRDRPAGIDLADAVVPHTGHERHHVKVAGRITCDRHGVGELRLNGRAAIAPVAPVAGAGDGGDDAGRDDSSNTVIPAVGDKHVPCLVDGYRGGVGESRPGGRAAVPAIAHETGSGESRDGPLGVDPADAVASAFRDIKVPSRIQSDCHREGKLGLRGRPAVSPAVRASRAGDGRDDPFDVDLADAMIPAVGNIHAALGVGSHPGRVAEPGLSGRAAVPVVSVLSRACDRRDDASGVDPADAVAACVDHVDVARRIQGKAARKAELRLHGRAAVPAVSFLPGSRQSVDDSGTFQSDSGRRLQFAVRADGDREHVLSGGGRHQEHSQAGEPRPAQPRERRLERESLHGRGKRDERARLDGRRMGPRCELALVASLETRVATDLPDRNPESGLAMPP